MKNSILLSRLIDNIPPLPAIANRVLYLARQDPLDFQELAAVIETDPALSAMVIRFANSPLYGPVRRRVDSLRRAIVVLGQNHIIDSTVIYITRTLKNISNASWPTGDLNFWKHSIGVAVAARMLALRMGVNHAQLCFLSGLMHDLGKLALLAHDAKEYTEVLGYAASSTQPLAKVELEHFGFTHAYIGGQICKKWYMPVTCTKAVSQHHDSVDSITVTVPNIIRSANLLVKVAGIGESGNAFSQYDIKMLMPHPQFDENDVYVILNDLRKTVDDLTGIIIRDRNGGANRDRDAIIKSSHEKAQVYTLVAKESDRVLLRYVLHALGYTEKVGVFEHNAQASDDIPHIKILDYMPEYVEKNEKIIDFGKWRSKQPFGASGERDIYSLRTWLLSELELATTPVLAI